MLRRSLPTRDILRGVLGHLLILVCMSSKAQSQEPSWTWEGLDYAEGAKDLCAGTIWSGQCAARLDSVLLADTQVVWRTDQGLHIRTGADSVVLLKEHKCDCESALRYRYVGLIPELRSHVFFAGQYEGRYYVMVDAASGDTTQLQSYPVVSPDGQRFATTSMDILAGDSANELQIWKITPDGPRHEWGMRPGINLNHPNPAVRAWGPIRSRWRDGKTLSVGAYAVMYYNPEQRDGGGVRRNEVAPGELIFQLVGERWLFRGYDP